MKTHFSNPPLQAYPPLNRSKNQTSKTHFFNKWKKQEESFINMNRSMVPKPSTPIKITKKFSFEMKNTNSQVNSSIGSLKILPKQKTVPKSKSTNAISKELTQNKIRKNTRRVPVNKTDQQIKLFQWRVSTSFPLIKIACVSSKQVSGGNSLKEIFSELSLEVHWQEDIKFNLNEIDQFSLLNSLYIIEESLVSFERLYNKFGYFEPSIKMIFITNSHKCKIWANENIWQNFPMVPKFVLRQNQKIENFYKKVIAMFSKYFKANTETHNQQENIKRSVNLIDKLIYELERRSDFIQGMKFIKEFMSAYSLKINNRFIYPIETSDTRSRIFSRLEKSQPNKGNSMAEIPIKQELPQKEQISIKQQITAKEEEAEDQEKHIKTLKNSYHKCSNQVLESNIKTIIMERKSQQKEKEIPFKKKSQISICSKQTIVEKKSRFSMYDQKQPIPSSNSIKSRHLPNFTQEDFNQEEDQANQIQESKEVQQNIKENDSPHQELCQIKDEEEYEQKVRNEIEKNVRQRNGWLQNPQLLFDTDDCAKSYQDSQPSIKMKIRQRNLSKLNRIKKSIAHSIND